MPFMRERRVQPGLRHVNDGAASTASRNEVAPRGHREQRAAKVRRSAAEVGVGGETIEHHKRILMRSLQHPIAHCVAVFPFGAAKYKSPSEHVATGSA
jgi:hypothetical protein